MVESLNCNSNLNFNLEEKGKELEKILKVLKTMEHWCNHKNRNRNIYIYLLENMKHYVHIDACPLFYSVRADIDNIENKNKKLVLNYMENNDTNAKICLWLEYIYNNLWKFVNYKGFGHLKTFNVKLNHIYCEINLRFALHKNFNETLEEYEKRKEKFNKFKEMFYFTTENNDGIYLKDNSKNKELIEKEIGQMCDIDNVKYKIDNGKIVEISFMLKQDSKFDCSFVEKCEQIINKNKINNEQEKEDIEITLLEFEKLRKDVEELISSVSLYLGMLENDSNNPNINIPLLNNFIQTVYYDMCKLVSLENEKTKEYESQLKIDNKKEMDLIYKNKIEIGKTFDFSELLSFAKKEKEHIESILLKDYCLSPDTYNVMLDQYGVFHINVLWSTLVYYHLKEEYYEKVVGKEKQYISDIYDDLVFDLNKIEENFDIIYNKNNQSSYLLFSNKNKETIQTLVKEIFKGKLKNIQIGFRNISEVIESFSFIIDLKEI